VRSVLSLLATAIRAGGAVATVQRFAVAGRWFASS
jgi:hypothetical protein